ncbi:MAG: hypothetical protein EXS63_03545 [Candidatus Omnitrophica bacterium]|nr:hypothetical protein [Candidatus Omnitrophota bacterium]
MTTLVKRLTFSSLFVALALLTIFAAPRWIFILVVEAFCLVGFHEFLALIEKKGVVVHKLLAMTLAVLIPILTNWGAEPVLFVLGILLVFVLYFREDLNSQVFGSVSMMTFGLVYVVWFFSHLIKMHDLIHGSSWVFYTILLVKAGDAGAYFVGTKYGTSKLAKHISPNKSIEGAWGGLATTLVLSLLSGFYLKNVFWGHLFILGILVSVIAQIGDLVESLMKRDVGVKDSGVIPGLGGVLDIMDSLLLTVPFVYYYVVFFLGFQSAH